MIRKGQCYGHKSLTKYFEIRTVWVDKNDIVQVDFIYYDSREDRERFACRPYQYLERLIDDGILIRD